MNWLDITLFIIILALIGVVVLLAIHYLKWWDQ